MQIIKLAAVVLMTATLGLAQTQPQQLPDPTLPETKAPAPVQNAPKKEDAGAAKARELLAGMIKALGGNAYLNYTAIEQTGRTYTYRHGEPIGAGTVFWRYWQWPDKERLEVTKERDWYFIYNGDKGWEVTFRGASPVETEMLEDYLRRRHYSLEQVTRVWIKQPDVAYFYEGPAVAAQRPVHQVTIMNANAEAVTLSLDTNTLLPVMKSFTWRDEKTRERNTETEQYDNYRPFGGVMTPQAVTRGRNGMNVNQRFITSTTYNTAIQPTQFDPNAQAQQRRK